MICRSNQRDKSTHHPGQLDWKTQKDRKCNYIAKLKFINRHYKILGLWSTNIFKEQSSLPLKLTVENFLCRQKRLTIEQLTQISVVADSNSKPRGIFKEKTPKSIHLWWNQFWNPIANVSAKKLSEETPI